VDAYVGNEFS